MSHPAIASPVRLAELLASMSLATDLGLGLPMEHVIRTSIIGLRLGEQLGLSEEERAVTYYTGLVAWVGCHADSHEQAAWFGDDIALRNESYDIDMKGPQAAAWMLRHVGRGSPPLRRARLAGSLLLDRGRAVGGMEGTHCLIAGAFAYRVGLGPEVREALQQVFERWDGGGHPAGLEGEQVALPARIVALATVVEVFRRRGGPEAALTVARDRSGSEFDPGLAECLIENAGDILADLDAETSWETVIDAEPALDRVLAGSELDTALEAMADFADLKSPYTAGHSKGVANLAAEAARAYGMPDGEVTELRRAALLHDLGRLGISNAIWDKQGPLTGAELERVRLHPYLTERMLAPSPALAALGALAAQHHERLDGTGYPRGLTGAGLGPASRILAAADVYHALTEPRPHRPERSEDEAAEEVRAEARAGRLDGEAVNAVLRAAGHRIRGRPELPGGLTPREVEVLALVARGHSNKEIAARLYVTPKTVSNHVEHIYAKIDVSSRAAASLFATQHGLLGSFESAES
ncbi:MAG: HD domain-containing phosphohydrolase [Solirubrobacterales bacterium]